MLIKFECLSACRFSIMHINERFIFDPYILYYSQNWPVGLDWWRNKIEYLEENEILYLITMQM